MSWIMTIALGAALGYFLVQFVVKNARTVNADAESAEGNGEARALPKGRLHRSTKDRKIAGVCGGIAEYLNVDSGVIRIVTVLLMFGWGSGLLAYIICALVLPEE